MLGKRSRRLLQKLDIQIKVPMVTVTLKRKNLRSSLAWSAYLAVTSLLAALYGKESISKQQMTTGVLLLLFLAANAIWTFTGGLLRLWSPRAYRLWHNISLPLFNLPLYCGLLGVTLMAGAFLISQLLVHWP